MIVFFIIKSTSVTVIFTFCYLTLVFILNYEALFSVWLCSYQCHKADLFSLFIPLPVSGVIKYIFQVSFRRSPQDHHSFTLVTVSVMHRYYKYTHCVHSLFKNTLHHSIIKFLDLEPSQISKIKQTSSPNWNYKQINIPNQTNLFNETKSNQGNHTSHPKSINTNKPVQPSQPMWQTNQANQKKKNQANIQSKPSNQPTNPTEPTNSQLTK